MCCYSLRVVSFKTLQYQQRWYNVPSFLLLLECHRLFPLFLFLFLSLSLSHPLFSPDFLFLFLIHEQSRHLSHSLFFSFSFEMRYLFTTFLILAGQKCEYENLNSFLRLKIYKFCKCNVFIRKNSIEIFILDEILSLYYQLNPIH